MDNQTISPELLEAAKKVVLTRKIWNRTAEIMKNKLEKIVNEKAGTTLRAIRKASREEAMKELGI